MQEIRPFSAEDCIDFIEKHRDEIQKGLYDIRINPDWVKSLKMSDLVLLIRSCSSEARENIASSIHTPADILELLSKDESKRYWIVKEAVARNTNTPLNVLEHLSRDKSGHCSDHVRKAVAENPEATSNILEVLARDEMASVRATVASHPNITANSLEIFARDGNAGVRASVIENPKTPVALLELLSKDEEVGVRKYLFLNPNTPVALLDSCLKDEDFDVIKFLLENPNTPVTVLKLLSKDKDGYIRHLAKDKLKSGFCFIATAVYGTDYSPEIVALKEFRDTRLLSNRIGRLFVRVYYKYSPIIARVIKTSVVLKNISKILVIIPLVKLVKRLYL
ncbi:MAG: hypothetical protein HQ551_13190 [Desulfobacteraceae bacterium]|nr:hypothetical protein [Desulfobacteraceae bacterium]